MTVFKIIFLFWDQVWLGLIIWTELLFLLAMLILKYVGESSVKRNPDDYVYHFARVWWATFKQKPSPISRPRMIDVEAGDHATAPLMDLIDEEAIEALGKPYEEHEEEEEREEREEAGEQVAPASGMRSATLAVRVIPGAGTDEVAGWMGKTLKIRVTAPQEGGQANKAVIGLLASTLGLRSHQVQLKRGHYEEQKVFTIAGLTQGELEERLASFT